MKTILQRCFEKIHFNTTTGCWEWLGNPANPYAQIKSNGKMISVNRFLYGEFIELIPNDLVYRHGYNAIGELCKTKCVNPWHARKHGTHSDNNKDRIEDGTWKNQNVTKTHCKNGHEYNFSNGKRRRCYVCEYSARGYTFKP